MFLCRCIEIDYVWKLIKMKFLTVETQICVMMDCPTEVIIAINGKRKQEKVPNSYRMNSTVKTQSKSESQIQIKSFCFLLHTKPFSPHKDCCIKHRKWLFQYFKIVSVIFNPQLVMFLQLLQLLQFILIHHLNRQFVVYNRQWEFVHIRKIADIIVSLKLIECKLVSLWSSSLHFFRCRLSLYWSMRHNFSINSIFLAIKSNIIYS